MVAASKVMEVLAALYSDLFYSSARKQPRTPGRMSSQAHFCKWDGGHVRKDLGRSVRVSANGEGQADDLKGNYRGQRKDGGRRRAGRHATSIALQVDRFRLNQDIEKLSRKESKLLPEALLEALNTRMRAGEVEKALKVFQLLRRQVWYVPKQNQYLSLLKFLAEHKQGYRASELWSALEEDELPHTVEVCTALLNVYVKSGHLHEAFEVFNLMKSGPHTYPDVYTYTILIKGLLEANEIEGVVWLLDEMDKSAIAQNTVTRNTLLASFGRTGNLKMMEDKFEHMCRNPSIHPDIYSWNIILKSYGRLGNIKKMEERYNRMQKMEVQPDLITFNTLINAYGKHREFEKMRAVADTMRGCYFSWNDVTFNTMIEAYGRAGKIHEMEEIYRIMKAKGAKRTAFTLTTLFNAYSKEEMWDKVEKIRREWKNSDIRADVIMYNSLLEAYRRSGNLLLIEETFQELEYFLLPDRASFEILANAYRSHGMRDKYNEVMVKLKFRPVR